VGDDQSCSDANSIGAALLQRRDNVHTQTHTDAYTHAHTHTHAHRNIAEETLKQASQAGKPSRQAKQASQAGKPNQHTASDVRQIVPSSVCPLLPGQCTPSHRWGSSHLAMCSGSTTARTTPAIARPAGARAGAPAIYMLCMCSARA
jgi:hypothetical protein